MKTSGRSELKYLPWILWPLVVVMVPAMLVILLFLLPVLVLAFLVFIPFQCILRHRLNKENLFFEGGLVSTGRVVPLEEIESALKNGEGTLLFESRGFVGCDRVWWTPDDVLDRTPLRSLLEPNANPNDLQLQELESFAKDCFSRYVDPQSGVAKLIEQKSKFAARNYPNVEKCQLIRLGDNRFSIFTY